MCDDSNCLQTILKLADELNHASKNSIYDPLTGLFSRRYFEENFKNEFDRSSREQYPLHLILIDFDKQKLNSNYCLDDCKKILAEAARLLSPIFRKSDLICRFDASGFVILLANLSCENFRVLDKRAREAVNTIMINGTRPKVNVGNIRIMVEEFGQNNYLDMLQEINRLYIRKPTL